MANKNALNKNSVYVQSLVDFLLDTKPYHSKLTEIVEEYRFFDEVHVNIEERFTSKTKINSTNLYNYFSAANSLYRSMPAKRALSPSFSMQSFLVGRDENKDLINVPHVYSKKSFDGDGVSSVLVNHGDSTHHLVESIDYFQSQGSFQFKVKQTVDPQTSYFDPLWSLTQEESIISDARAVSMELALDPTNPSSAISRIRAILDLIQKALINIGGNPDAQRELTGYPFYSSDLSPSDTSLYGILNKRNLPQSYEALFAWLAVLNDNMKTIDFLDWIDEDKRDEFVAPTGPDGDPLSAREWLDQQLSSHSAPLVFGLFSDRNNRESGRVEYPYEVKTDYIRITNIRTGTTADVEEWALTAENGTYRMVGSTSGFVGFVYPGQPFNSFRISFDTELIAEAPTGSAINLTPTRKLVIGRRATAEETWNIIKVNPLAYDRPHFISSRYGAIKDTAGRVGKITIKDLAFPTSDIAITARDDKFFDLQSLTYPDYTGVVQVNVPFDDGRLAFTITSGSIPFVKGEQFLISIKDIPPSLENLDIGFGYDVEPYDGEVATPSGLLQFTYDGRFTNYDLARLNIVLSPGAQSGRKWRARAHYLGGETLLAAINGVNIYRAATFKVESSIDNFATFRQEGFVSVGSRFSTLDVEFTIAEGPNPFVVLSSPDDNGGRVIGGDTISFDVVNPDPEMTEAFAQVISPRRPYLAMHAGNFFDAIPAEWTITFTSPKMFNISAVQNGAEVLSRQNVSIANGQSFKDLGVHFTIVSGLGLEAGDKFKFRTFDQKPSYLVHGSMTGWTAPATVGKYYWNGKIGFKIRKPSAKIFINNVLVNLDLDLDISLRDDAPPITYTFVRNAYGYSVTRSDTGASVFGSTTGVFTDKYITIDLSKTNESMFKVAIDSHDFNLWNTADVIILNSPTPARMPVNGDLVLVEKTEEAKVSLNLVPGPSVSLSDLSPITIDQRFIDINTRGVPLSFTSPETALFPGWIPITLQKFNGTSEIVFNDPATRFVVRSSTTNEQIGELRRENTNPNEPVIFEWAKDFFSKYLPLNAEANIVISETGWNDKVHAHIAESVKFLISGGALADDWMFKDTFKVNFVDENFFMIKQNLSEETVIEVKDGPFVNFLPGYDNLPYDGSSPYEVVTALPKIYTAGETFYNNTDKKLYTFVDGQWNDGTAIVESETATGSVYYNPASKRVFRKTTVEDTSNLVAPGVAPVVQPWPHPGVYEKQTNGLYSLYREVPSGVHGNGCEPLPPKFQTTNYFQRPTPCGWAARGYQRDLTLPTKDVWTSEEVAGDGPTLPTVHTNGTKVFNSTEGLLYTKTSTGWGVGVTPPVEIGADGRYDEGLPPDILSLLAQANLTAGERKSIFDRWNNFLLDENPPTTEEQWAFMRSALEADPSVIRTSDFGVPVVGLAMDIVDRSPGSASASFRDVMVSMSTSSGNLMEAGGYDSGPLDEQGDKVAVMFAGALPIPVPQLPADYESLDIPLSPPARVFEITYTATNNTPEAAAALKNFRPTLSIWLPGDRAPTPIKVVESFERVPRGRAARGTGAEAGTPSRLFRFSFAKPTEGKIIVG